MFDIQFEGLNDLRYFMCTHSHFCLMVPPDEKVTKKKEEKITFFNFVLHYVNVLFLSFVGILRLKSG